MLILITIIYVMLSLLSGLLIVAACVVAGRVDRTLDEAEGFINRTENKLTIGRCRGAGDPAQRLTGDAAPGDR